MVASIAIREKWTAQEKRVIDTFVQAVRDTVGERAKRIILYGSRARGDADVDSDFDFLVLIEPFYTADKHIIREIGNQVSFDTNCYVSVRTIREAEFTEDRFFYFYENVNKEGIDL
ncbi:MAG: nucleotidyltransferase domain-containing protein [bacterium]